MTALRPALAASAAALLLLMVAATAANAQTAEPQLATATSPGADTPTVPASPAHASVSERTSPALKDRPPPTLEERPPPALVKSPPSVPEDRPSINSRSHANANETTDATAAKMDVQQAAVTPLAASSGPPGFIGCFGDDNYRSLPLKIGDDSQMNSAACRRLALAQNLPYFGTQLGNQCWAGNSLERAKRYGPADGECTMRCAVSPNRPEHCGNAWRNSLYYTCATGFLHENACVDTCPTGTKIGDRVCFTCPGQCAECSSATSCSSCKKGFNLVDNERCEPLGWLGCFIDDASDPYYRRLPTQLSSDPAVNMTSAACRKLARAQNLPYFGTQNGYECWAGSDLERAQRYGSYDVCTVQCTGSSLEYCGATRTDGYSWSANSLYSTCATGLFHKKACVDACPTGTYASGRACFTCPRQCAECSSATTCSSCKTGFNLVDDERCEGPGSIGCFFDYTANEEEAALPTKLSSDPAVRMTSAVCRRLALAKNLPYFGTRNGYECWAGSSLQKAGWNGRADGECNAACTGSSLEACGSPTSEDSSWGTISIYSTCITGLVHRKTCVDTCPTGTYLGDGACIACPRQCAECSSATSCSSCKKGFNLVDDQRCERPGFIGCFLDNTEAEEVRALPTRLSSDPAVKMSSAVCRRLALAQSLPYFATQNGSECWAGSDLGRAKETGPADGECTAACTGSSLEDCGGAPDPDYWYGVNSLYYTCATGFFHNKACVDACPTGTFPNKGVCVALPTDCAPEDICGIDVTCNCDCVGFCGDSCNEECGCGTDYCPNGASVMRAKAAAAQASAAPTEGSVRKTNKA
ncbi:hypothetical protein Rsub_01288 [Raphidocelis subcapitata]|uniref:WSC domain-containing protein n=1 Tax=Raphidocelis subcapitata TaxID=307507 RepID=A0A2V0NSR0_9CHLO|nr:hypothetical protein Rsub_01288 [Raphidocelis subcapitata]|eukprot:GBF88573.1 hypothetical protein Rsub_01288 [Raphidocelis subcapitata]